MSQDNGRPGGPAASQPGSPHTARVLVTVASRHGATAEIAETIAAELTTAGLAATVADPGDVTSVDGYDAVILGSAVYGGHWLEPAKDLAIRLPWALGARPVWLLSSGPVGGPGRKLAQAMRAEPAEVAGIRLATHARGHRMFAGKLNPQDLTRPQRAALAVFRGLAGDFRDWAAIRGWAREIAAELSAPARAA